MIQQIVLKNFGPLRNLEWKGLGKINLIIGRNGSGKTFLLKSVYCSLKTLEGYKRGHEQRSASEILADKLYWTFQAKKIGDLVSKGEDAMLEHSITVDDREFRYSFGKDTTKQIKVLENHVEPLDSNSIFLPAKEVLSLHNVILKSREQDQVFGFDDTYLDLARAIRPQPKRGKNIREFAKSRQRLEELIGGRIEFSDENSTWHFRKGKQRFPIEITAEGVKKIALLDTLLGNHYLGRNSIVLIDEPESALHPGAISKLLDIIAILSEAGIQFLLASHSYFVVKKLYLLAQGKAMSVPILWESETGEWKTGDLQKAMPDNSIIRESIALYEQEVELALK